MSSSLPNCGSRCLERVPKLRLRDIGEARIALRDVNDTDSASQQTQSPLTAPPHASPGRPTIPGLLAGLGIGVAAVALGFNMFHAAAPVQPVRFTVSYPSTVRPLSNGSDYHGIALSPDGLRAAFSRAAAIATRTTGAPDRYG